MPKGIAASGGLHAAQQSAAAEFPRQNADIKPVRIEAGDPDPAFRAVALGILPLNFGGPGPGQPEGNYNL